MNRRSEHAALARLSAEICAFYGGFLGVLLFMQRRFLRVWLARVIPCQGPCHGRAKRTTRTPLNSNELMSRHVIEFAVCGEDHQCIVLIDKNANGVGRDRLDHNPCVGGSSPSSATIHNLCIRNLQSTYAQRCCIWRSGIATRCQAVPMSYHGWRQFRATRNATIQRCQTTSHRDGSRRHQHLGMAAEPAILLVVRPCGFRM